MNPILEEDLKSIVNSQNISWDTYDGYTFLITGATGLIGSLFVRSVLCCNQMKKMNIQMILVVRDKERAEQMFGTEFITYIESSVEELEEIAYDFDVVIHCASPTKSKYFIENPVETMNSSILGTQKVLELCKGKNIQKFLYLSSMEMYGVLHDENVTEEKSGFVNPLEARSSYSMSKRASELYCYSYFKEYDVPIVIARLAMCFGAGVSREENRVYKYFCDSVLDGKDIEVKSTGKTILNFIYTKDAIESLFLLLQKGENGEAYNVSSNPSNFTIMDMAKYLASEHGEGIRVIHNIPKENMGYAPENQMILSNAKLKQLGKSEFYNIREALDRMMEYFIYEKRD